MWWPSANEQAKQRDEEEIQKEQEQEKLFDEADKIENYEERYLAYDQYT